MYKNKVEISSLCTSKIKTLTREESEELQRRIKKGDTAAREEFVMGNLRLVLSVLQKYSGGKEYADDLFQVGVIGLLKATDNFDPSVGVMFSTYAVPTNVLR